MRSMLILALAVLIMPAAKAADIKVLDSVDIISLADGQEVRGTVIAAGMRSVIILVEGRERIIRRSEVKDIVRGEALPMIRSYMVENVDGLAVVVGEGSGDSAVSEAAGQSVAGTPASPVPQKAAKTAEPELIPAATVKELMKDPKIGNLVKQFGGEEKAMQMLRQHSSNPIVRNFLDEFKKTGRVPAGLERFLP